MTARTHLHFLRRMKSYCMCQQMARPCKQTAPDCGSQAPSFKWCDTVKLCRRLTWLLQNIKRLRYKHSPLPDPPRLDVNRTLLIISASSFKEVKILSLKKTHTHWPQAFLEHLTWRDVLTPLLCASAGINNEWSSLCPCLVIFHHEITTTILTTGN